MPKPTKPKTSDEVAFLRAICENPLDDNVRLFFCDWLDENGQGDRATFIRAQIAHPEVFRDDWQDNGSEVLDLSVYSYLNAYSHTDADAEFGPVTVGSWVWKRTRPDGVRGTYVRGFIGEVTMTMAQFADLQFNEGYEKLCQHIETMFEFTEDMQRQREPALFRQHPITKITFSDSPLRTVTTPIVTYGPVTPLIRPLAAVLADSAVGMQPWQPPIPTTARTVSQTTYAFNIHEMGPLAILWPGLLALWRELVPPRYQRMMESVGSEYIDNVDFDTKEQADAALSLVAVTHARNLVGLPPLEKPKELA